MKRHAIRRPASHPLHRLQRRRAWARIRPWLEDIAALVALAVALGAYFAIAVMLLPR